MPTDTLVEAVWGARPPASARRNLQLYVHQLRRVLGADLVVARGLGYAVEVGDGLDAAEFRRLAADGGALLDAGDPATAERTLRNALDLWHGQAFTESLDCAPVADEAQRLELLRLETYELWAEAQLATGATPRLAAELAELCRLHPYRETLRAYLMRALYQTGRQAEALAAFREARAWLVEQLGVEPGPGLQRLHEAILRGEESLLPVAQPGSQPAQLPLDVPDFTGRSGDVEQLLATVQSSRSVVVSAIDGMAGIGKTALAVHVAHRLADHFPDGQLFLDLRAYRTDADPMEPAEALDFLLRSIGVPRERIPDGVDERAALWRTTLARRRFLIVLDNAIAVDQVRPLVPGAGECAVLITSRRRLTALEGVRCHLVDLLPDAEAAALFRATAGPRAEAEPDTVAEVVGLCGRLPLAIRIAASRLSSRPQWTVSDLAERLRRHRRLAELSVDGSGIESVLNMSYQHLNPAERQLYRRLGLHPGADFDAYIAAALANVPPEKADALLESLLDVHLATQHVAGRYRLHDLLREHARTTAMAEESLTERAAAIDRLLDFYLHTVNAACDLIEPTRRQVDSVVTQKPAAAPTFAKLSEALAWLDIERANVVAAVHHAAGEGRPRHAWQITYAVRAYYVLQGNFEESLATHRDAIRAARDINDRWAEATTLNDLGTLLFAAGRLGEAHDRYQQSLALHRQIEDWYGVACALVNLGGVLTEQKRPEEGLDYSWRGHDLFQQLGDVHGQAAALGNIGSTLTDLARYPEALDHLRRSLAMCHDRGQRRNEASLWGMIGLVHRKLGDTPAAIEANALARMICREIGYRGGEARRSVALGELHHEAGEDDEARVCFEEALTVARQAGNRYSEAGAYEGLAELLTTAGDTEAAAFHWRRAVAIYTDLAHPKAAEVQARLQADHSGSTNRPATL